MNSVKKLVSGSISKTEKFMGAGKLALAAAGKTAKGAIVKYAVPAANRVVSGVKQTVTTGAKFTKGAVLGVCDAGKSTITGISSMIRHPIQTVKGIAAVVSNPKQTLPAITTGAKNVGKAFLSGNAETRGRIIGRAAGEIGLAFVGTKGADKLAKVAKGSRAAAELTSAAKVTRVSNTIQGTSQVGRGFEMDLQLFARKAQVTGEASKLYHYTSANPQDILKGGLKPGGSGQVFTTPTGNLSPLQAQIDLALPPNRGLPQHLIEIDVQTLKNMGVNVPQGQQVTRMFNMPGGGTEVVFPHAIPQEALKVIR